jgi:hypothetical protein
MDLFRQPIAKRWAHKKGKKAKKEFFTLHDRSLEYEKFWF